MKHFWNKNIYGRDGYIWELHSYPTGGESQVKQQREFIFTHKHKMMPKSPESHFRQSETNFGYERHIFGYLLW